MLPTQAPRRLPGDGFWRKTWAVLVKEFIQLKRDRVSFAMIIMIPLVQLMLFGYAINTTPRDLPTAVLLQEHSDLARSILAALENTEYFKVTELSAQRGELDELLASGKVLFAIEIPAQFRARGAARRQAGHAGGGRRHRSGRRRLGAQRARPGAAERARRTTATFPRPPCCRSKSAPTRATTRPA